MFKVPGPATLEKMNEPICADWFMSSSGPVTWKSMSVFTPPPVGNAGIGVLVDVKVCVIVGVAVCVAVGLAVGVVVGVLVGVSANTGCGAASINRPRIDMATRPLTLNMISSEGFK
jgi:hypothetical protein